MRNGRQKTFLKLLSTFMLVLNCIELIDTSVQSSRLTEVEKILLHKVLEVAAQVTQVVSIDHSDSGS